MAKITAIAAQEKDKNRCNLFIDGEFCLALPIDTVLDYRLKVGDEIAEDKLREIRLEGDKAFALKKAVAYVGAGMKTKKQVITYLRRKELSDNAVFYAIDKLKEYGLIDDEEYAKRYIETCSKTNGKKLASFKLMEKGVSKDVIEKAYEDVNPLGKENAKALAERRLHNKEITKELLQKTYRYLLSRGFSYEEVEYAISSVKGEN